MCLLATLPCFPSFPTFPTMSSPLPSLPRKDHVFFKYLDAIERADTRNAKAAAAIQMLKYVLMTPKLLTTYPRLKESLKENVYELMAEAAYITNEQIAHELITVAVDIESLLGIRD